MLKRPAFANSESGVFALRGKFNSVLEEQLHYSKRGKHHIMSVDIKLDEFDRQGNSNSFGKSLFWKEVDRAMKRFDLGEKTLNPRKQIMAKGITKAVGTRPATKHIQNQMHQSQHQPVACKRLWSPVPASLNKQRKKSSRSQSRIRSDS